MISVLLPTYNQAQHLPAALASLKAQDCPYPFEVIACDDGSTDETPQILADAVIKTVTHDTNRGTAEAINSAAALADAKYLTWVSSDNLMHPQWLAMLAGYLECHEEAQAVFSAYDRLDLFSAGKTRPRTMPTGPYDRRRLISSLDCYFGPSFLVRREHWLEHRDGLAHDYDWWLRIEERTRAIGYCPASLCTYRMGPWQTGRNRPKELVADAQRRQAEARERRAEKMNPGRKNRNLKECITLATEGCDFVVELGCGFGDRLALVDGAHVIGIDAHEPYIAEARRRYPEMADCFIVGDAHDYIRQCKDVTIDAVLMVDFLEHLSTGKAKSLIADCKRVARRIVLWIPLGQHPQTSDPYGMGGDHWQTHRSTWEPADLESLGFDVKEWQTIPNRPDIAPRAAFCVWEAM